MTPLQLLRVLLAVALGLLLMVGMFWLFDILPLLTVFGLSFYLVARNRAAARSPWSRERMR